jgi:hypothetical protein
MQENLENVHARLNHTMRHYVNKYVNDWVAFVDYAIMVYRSTSHTTTMFSPYFLLHDPEMRLSATDDM